MAIIIKMTPERILITGNSFTEPCARVSTAYQIFRKMMGYYNAIGEETDKLGYSSMTYELKSDDLKDCYLIFGSVFKELSELYDAVVQFDFEDIEKEPFFDVVEELKELPENGTFEFEIKKDEPKTVKRTKKTKEE